MDADKRTAEVAKALQAKIMKALEDAGCATCGDEASEITENAIVAALTDFAHDHPLHVTVTVDDPSDRDMRKGFLRCTVREVRPSLEE